MNRELTAMESMAMQVLIDTVEADPGFRSVLLEMIADMFPSPLQFIRAVAEHFEQWGIPKPRKAKTQPA